MRITTSNQDSLVAAGDLLILPVLAPDQSKPTPARSTAAPTVVRLTGQARACDKALESWLTERIQEEQFTGAVDQSVVVHAHRHVATKRIALLGIGSQADLTLDQLRRLAARSVVLAKQLKAKRVVIDLSDVEQLFPSLAKNLAAISQAITEGCELAGYRFHKYKKIPAAGHYAGVQQVALHVQRRTAALQDGVRQGQVIAKAVMEARDLVNEPAVHLAPRHLAARARGLDRLPGVQVRIFNEAQIRKLRMGAFLAVAAGSDEQPYFVHLSYKSPRRGKRPLKKVAICGKGITFDSGGISIKPSSYMDTMKMDMAGAAVIVGLFSQIHELGLEGIELHGVFAATENMPSGKATKPGDVVTAYNGTTIEINNTDAEGRLILADALAWTIKTIKPAVVLDIATLTGAAIVALGQEVAALMGSDDEVAQQFLTAAEVAGEQTCRLPLVKEYIPLLESQIADLQNSPSTNWAGAIIGGLFLQKFVGDTPWLHLDIAGPAWVEKQILPYASLGASGFGVRTVVAWLKGL